MSIESRAVQQVIRAGVRVTELGQSYSGIALAAARQVAYRAFLPEVQRSIRAHKHQDTGGLMASFRVVETPAGDGTAIAVVSNAVQANILNAGGTITPKRARYLTVPVAKQAKHRRAADFPNAFVAGRPGKLFIAEKYGRGKKLLRVLFALRSSVTLPASHYLDEAEDNAVARAPGVVRQFITERLQRIADGGQLGGVD